MSEEQKKIKLLTLSDSPLSPSGVGTQQRYIIEHLLSTGKYQVISLGGAVKHHDYRPIRFKEFGDDWVIYPVDGYGTQDLIRSVLEREKPDIIQIFTDPRYWTWLWEMEDEIREHCSLAYYHVWDNFPLPTFNKPYYESNDIVVAISKLTEECVRNVAPEVPCIYHPHSVDTEIFKRLTDDEIEKFRLSSFPNEPNSSPFTIFWNSRNARRKQSGSLIFWFKTFLDKVGKGNARLIMHTDPFDHNGQNLEAIINHLGINNGEVLFSRNKLGPKEMNVLYNLADCTMCVSDAEGFGLGNQESLAAETPIIVNMTGGPQELVSDGKEWFGIGMEPVSKSIIGSQEIPWIFEDRLSEEQVVGAMMKMYEMSKEERRELGKKGRNHVLTNYNFQAMVEGWDKIFTDLYEKNGSWGSRRNYDRWTFKEIAPVAESAEEGQ